MTTVVAWCVVDCRSVHVNIITLSDTVVLEHCHIQMLTLNLITVTLSNQRVSQQVYFLS